MASAPDSVSAGHAQLSLLHEQYVGFGDKLGAAGAVDAPLVEVRMAARNVWIRRSHWARVRAAQGRYAAVANLQGAALSFFQTADMGALGPAVDAAAHTVQAGNRPPERLAPKDRLLGIAPHLGDKQHLNILDRLDSAGLFSLVQGGVMDDLPAVQEQPIFPVVPVAAIRDRMTAVKQLSHEIMREHVHYGSVTGPEGKKSLWKSGAELLCMTFRIAWRFEVDDLSRPDEIRYRVRCTGMSATGEILGDGMGECSSSEEKYKWRRAVVEQEWDAFPESMRREKFNRGKQGSFYLTKQVRTEPADYGNTILKMACKRAHVAMTLGVTGTSDEFTQDLDDDEQGPGDPPSDEPPPAPRQPQRKSESPPPPAGQREPPSTSDTMKGERAFIERKLRETGKDLAPLLAEAGMGSLEDLNEENFKVLKGMLG